MYRITVTNNAGEVFTAMRVGLEGTPGRMQKQVQIKIRERSGLILRPVLVTPGPPQYPIRWKSRRQERAWWATNGFGKGIPYARSGTTLASYAVETTTTPSGGQVDVVNTSPYAVYVIGEKQQPFLTQWIPIDAAVEPGGVLALEGVLAAWYVASDPFGSMK